MLISSTGMMRIRPRAALKKMLNTSRVRTRADPSWVRPNLLGGLGTSLGNSLPFPVCQTLVAATPRRRALSGRGAP